MELSTQYFQLRKQKDDLNRELDQINELLQACEKDIILWMENNNFVNFKTPDGMIYLRSEVYARIDDQEKAFKFFEDNNMEDIIKRTVHAKTLSSLVKEMGEIPGVVAHYETKIGMRRGE